MTRVGNFRPGAVGYIEFYKKVGEREYEYQWAISNAELRYLPAHILYQEADRRMSMLENTIAADKEEGSSEQNTLPARA